MRENILIVDDQIRNLKLLTQMLEHEGYIVRPVTNGETAIMTARFEMPDLILLDINMPGLDGYQVCEEFKRDNDMKDIPIVFLTASDHTMDKMRAFNVGGVDYITKPFQLEEVKERIRTHLTINSQRKILRLKNEQLEEGYARLHRLEKLKDDLVYMIVHDMRNILQGARGYLELLRLGRQIFPEKYQSYIERANDCTQDLTEMVNSLIDINQIENGKLKLNIIPCEAIEIINRALKQIEGMCGRRNVSIQAPEYPVSLLCDPEITGRVLLNLMHNAIKSTDDNGLIWAGFENLNSMVRFYVRDNGPGVPAQFHDKIFEKFGRYDHKSSREKPCSTGLGLAFCKLGTEIQGGKIGVESAAGEGSTFWFIIPAI